nr:YqcI/YcgG family protein [Pseudomonas luteola]
MSLAYNIKHQISIYDRKGVEERYEGGSWQYTAFSEIAERLDSVHRPFPCVFGTSGFRTDQLRYFFIDELDYRAVASALRDYLKDARSFGQNTSLIVMLKTEEVRSMEEYYHIFWKLLDNLVTLDDQQWPGHVPTDVEDPYWEFCFAGEPIFVVCTTPAHIRRQSRRSTHVTFLFQPRWVFQGILGTKEKAERAFTTVRSLLKKYDVEPLSPYLGKYGDPNNYENKQYFLDDSNKDMGCPFQKLGQNYCD